MYQNIQDIVKLKEPITFILNNGFEERSPRGAELLHDLGLKKNQVVLLKYPGKENEKNYAKVSTIGRTLVHSSSQYREISSRDAASLALILANLNQERGRVVCDITGLSRHLMLSVLTQIYREGITFSLIGLCT